MARHETRPVPPPQRSWLAQRWRQARNPPPPVFRAVMANLVVAAIGGLVLLGYELLVARSASPWAADLRVPLVALHVLCVIVAGSLLTYLWVELPTGASGERRRTWWAALLGFFASLPIAYLSLVVIFQIVRPWFG